MFSQRHSPLSEHYATNPRIRMGLLPRRRCKRHGIGSDESITSFTRPAGMTTLESWQVLCITLMDRSSPDEESAMTDQNRNITAAEAHDIMQKFREEVIEHCAPKLMAEIMKDIHSAASKGKSSVSFSIKEIYGHCSPSSDYPQLMNNIISWLTKLGYVVATDKPMKSIMIDWHISAHRTSPPSSAV